MKLVIAIDSFKESVSAKEACQAVAAGFTAAYGQVEVVQIPLADGGEGTQTVLSQALAMQTLATVCRNSRGELIDSSFAYDPVRKEAVIEVAQAIGLNMIPPKARKPIDYSSAGVGDLLKAALKQDVERIYLCLGGSGTCDGGLGMLHSLGAGLFDQEGKQVNDSIREISRIQTIDLQPVKELLGTTELVVVGDVTNPYTGNRGATYTFGPQKGLVAEELEYIEQQLRYFNNLCQQKLGIDLNQIPGTGAAGGLGGALTLCGAKIVKGIDLVLEVTNFTQALENCDLIITGEGGIDNQSAQGKTISGVASRAQRKNIPVIALAGRVADDLADLYAIGISAVFSITDGAKSLEQALKDGPKCLYKTAYNLGKLWKIWS